MKTFKQQFFDKRNDYINKKAWIEYCLEQKNSKKDEKKLLLELLWYCESMKVLLTNWKDLGFLSNETANFYIAHLIRQKQTIFYKLTN